jgi:microcin C transport system substrate-binding protein
LPRLDSFRPDRRQFSRRAALLAAGALLPACAGARAFAQQATAPDEESESHGLSSFGDLALPADFPHLPYVDPATPKGGVIKLQIKQAGGNQNFETFDTLNIYTFKGDGAAGMGSTFDSLMSGSGDEPDAAYGLVARAVRVSADKLSYRFLLRPEARFHDGSPLTAEDAAFSLNILKSKGHPSYKLLLSDMESALAEGPQTLHVRFVPKRSRDAHLIVAGMPIFSAKYWETRDFEASTLDAPLGSGAYKVARFEQGRFIEFERVKDYWAANLPINVGLNNFDRVRYEYSRDRTLGFEDFKAGRVTFNEEYTSRIWNTGYDFPAVKDGRVKRVTLPDGKPVSSQGWYFNTRREAFSDPRVREAIGLAFDFEWANANLMFGSYKRLHSYFQNSPMMAVDPPTAEELALLEPHRASLPAEVFGAPFVPPVSDGSGSDRALLRRADELLRAAGCKREGATLKLPNGKPLTLEFLDTTPLFQGHLQSIAANLKKLGIEATQRIVDSAQYKRRLDQFDFDVVSMALGGSVTPGVELRGVFSAKAADTPGSRNLGGVKSPAVDALVEAIATATTKVQAQTAARALDRVLRAGRYWIPHWYRDVAWIAYWDGYDLPEKHPRYSTGAPDLWRWNPDKAQRVGISG